MAIEVADWNAVFAKWQAALVGADDTIRWRRQDLTEADPSFFPALTLRAGASESQIDAMEKRLGRQVPPSYRALLRATNGCRCPGFTIDELFSTETVGWFRDLEPAWVQQDMELVHDLHDSGLEPPLTDAEYLIYGPLQFPEMTRLEYEEAALQISPPSLPYGQEVFLLNPEIQTSEGEWEAWARSLPTFGAVRYPSLFEMMSDQIDRFLVQQAEIRNLPYFPDGNENV